MLKIGFIKLYRSLINWEWYRDTNTKVVFLHLLLTANYEDKKWQGIDVKRGQRLISNANLAKEVNLSIQNIRTAMQHLKSTGELTIQTTRHYTLIDIVNYSVYQDGQIETNNQANTLINKQLTNNQQTTNNNERKIKKDKKDKEVKNNIYSYFSNENINKLFLEYLEVRKKIKLATTERAVTMLVNKLSPCSDVDKIIMLENAILGNWKSIYTLVKAKEKADKPANKFCNFDQGEVDYDELEKNAFNNK